MESSAILPQPTPARRSALCHHAQPKFLCDNPDSIFRPLRTLFVCVHHACASALLESCVLLDGRVTGGPCQVRSGAMEGQMRRVQEDFMEAAQELQMKGMMCVTGAMTVNLIALGDELGLYAALKAGSGPMTSTDLAKATGTHERWTREWLYQQVASAVNMSILWRTCAAM